jgi:homogentisate 1,2-dioxygenase
MKVVYTSFDVVGGWDGYNFPYGFSIHNFEPITGRVHQPPPVHQTFETATFVVCSFCPRLYDTTQNLFQHLTIIVILIVMRFCIM